MRKARTLLQAFFNSREIKENGCWEFTGKVSYHQPYGEIKFNGVRWKLHRLSMFLHKPEGYSPYIYVLHKCNNKKCFNPEHLYYGTQTDNMQDVLKAGDNQHAKKTHCDSGHEFTQDNIYTPPGSTRRECRACKKEFARKAYQLSKGA